MTPAPPPPEPRTAAGFALYSRKGRRGKWKLHGVYPTHAEAWEASAAIPPDRPHVWITQTTDEPEPDRAKPG